MTPMRYSRSWESKVKVGQSCESDAVAHEPLNGSEPKLKYFSLFGQGHRFIGQDRRNVFRPMYTDRRFTVDCYVAALSVVNTSLPLHHNGLCCGEVRAINRLLPSVMPTAK